MAEKYAQGYVREVTTTKGGKKRHKAWKGFLKYRDENPFYVEDDREPLERRRYLDRTKEKPNPLYREDTREPRQRSRYVWRQIATTFNSDEVRTKSDAIRALEVWRKKKEDESASRDEDATLLVDYIENFITDRLNSKIIEASTARDYRHSLARIKKRFADVALASLDHDMVKKWEQAEIRRGVSATTVIKAHRLLCQVCKAAAARGVISSDPMRLVEPPKRIVSKPNALDEDGMKRLTSALALMEATPIATAAFLALHAGLRQGECCGLMWQDVDLDGAEIHIARTVGVGDGGAYIKAPKTAKSLRDVPIDSELVAKLRQRKERMVNELESADIDPTSERLAKLYVCGTIDGRYLHTTQLSRKWSLLADDFGLIGTQGKKVVFTDLRHSYATAALRGGADVVNVSANMGHASARMTLDTYASPTRQGQRAVADVIGKAMQ